MMTMVAAGIAGVGGVPPAAGRWEIRTLVSGDDAVAVAERCLRSSRDWLRDVLPRAITAGCGELDAAATVRCGRGGSLSLTGTVASGHFDIIVTRIGRVGANPRAVAALHVEGRRVAACGPDGKRAR